MTNGPTLPDDTHIGRVALQIGDVARSLEFYRDLIGFRVVDRVDDPAAPVTRLGAAGSDRVLLELHEARGAKPVPRRGLLGLYHFAVLLPTRGDLGRFLVHAADAGAQVAAADHLVSEALYLVDPDGLTIEVYRDRPRSEWAHADGAVRMTTLPLDRDDVARAAAGAASWDGLPAGTTVGHMHFHVGDLPTAEAFYHHALGFTPVVRSFPGALFVAAGGYHHHVGLNTWAAGSRVATAGDAKLHWWEVVVPDQNAADAAAARLERGGYAVTTSGGVHRAVDPWGIDVRIVASPS